MLLVYLVLNSIYGLICGLAWSFALGLQLTKGMKMGTAIGLIIGLFLYLYAKSAKAGGTTEREANVVTGYFSYFILFGGIITALIAWLVRIFII